MVYFKKGNVRTYYEHIGQGEPIIANHGLMEDTGYWHESGVAQKLAKKYRVISYDMRAHGHTVVDDEPYGYDVDTMARDIDDLADHLKLDKFHLLTHATGGMVGVRYAMSRSVRLLSLMLTDTGSATQPEFPGVTREQFRSLWTAAAERRKTVSVEEWIAGTRANPGSFLFKMAEHPDAERMWRVYEGCVRHQDPKAAGEFMASFYNDPDPHTDRLRQIKCPTLILLGEFDVVFLGPSALMAKEIPNAKQVIIPGVGHMTALEATERTVQELLDFLKSVSKTRKTTKR